MLWAKVTAEQPADAVLPFPWLAGGNVRDVIPFTVLCMHGVLQPLQGEMEKGRRDLTWWYKEKQIPLPAAPLCCSGFCALPCPSLSHATSLSTAEPRRNLTGVPTSHLS